MQPRICIVTPCLNSEQVISDTMYSVLNNRAIQENLISVEYIISDGVSVDKTLILARQIQAENQYDNLTITITSQPDNSMYDATVQGYLAAENVADIYCYLGAGDLFSPDALGIVANVMMNEGVDWITGLKVSYNELGHLTHAHLPLPYYRRMFRSGMYGRFLRFVVWESTFWSARLHEQLDLKKLASYRLAGEQFMWQTFSKSAELYVVQAWLGGFRRYPNQLSSDMTAYLNELDEIVRRPHLGEYLMALPLRLAEFLPDEIKTWIWRNRIFQYDALTKRYKLHKTIPKKDG